VQLGFLPTERPRIRDYRFYDFYEAAFRVGGDFFDYITLPDGRVAITVGDVAGKGVPAALLMARLYSMARYQLLTEPNAARAMTALNAGIATTGLGHRFITFVIVVLDAQAHTVTIVNAGHLPPVLRDQDGKVSTLGSEISGLPLGVKLDCEYQQTTREFRPGDTMLLFTDGVNEAMNAAHEIYGMTRLLDCVARTAGTVEEMGEELVADVERFCEGCPQRDDICLVCFRRSA
jgi:serine phosphatase RsbU (regulator of sigma subunit)